MSNPYAPPSTKEDVPPIPANKDTLLRRIGALAIAYILAKILWNAPQNLAGTLGAAATMSACLYGFLRGKRKSHLAIALYMILIFSVQSYFMNLALAHPERLMVGLGPHPWLDFAWGLTPNTIAFICATALYIRARRAPAPGH